MVGSEILACRCVQIDAAVFPIEAVDFIFHDQLLLALLKVPKPQGESTNPVPVGMLFFPPFRVQRSARSPNIFHDLLFLGVITGSQGLGSLEHHVFKEMGQAA